MISNACLGRINEANETEKIRKQGYKLLGRHPNDNRNGTPRWGGWPDRIAINPKNGTLHFFEIKTGNHELDPHQKLVLGALAKIGKVHLIRYEHKQRVGEEEILPLDMEELISK